MTRIVTQMLESPKATARTDPVVHAYVTRNHREETRPKTLGVTNLMRRSTVHCLCHYVFLLRYTIQHIGANGVLKCQ
jgi:hypothetical protein